MAREREDRAWLVALGVFLVTALAFESVVALTALAGGHGYVPMR